MNKILIFGAIFCIIIGFYYFYNQQKNNSTEEIKTLSIEILQEGTGEPAKDKDELTTYYAVWSEDGNKLDFNFDESQPFVFTLGTGQIIKGLEEGMLGVKAGEKRKLKIPYYLAYGEEGMVLSSGGVVIPPKTNLIFEIEVISIQ